MLKTETGNMDDYAAKMMQYAETNMDQVKKSTYEKQKEGESVVQGYFMHYTDFDKGQNRMVTTDQVPAGLAKKTSKGGTMYLKNFEVILSSIAPNDDVTLNTEDGTYTINVEIKLDNKSQAQTLQYLRDHKMDRYYDFENDCVRKSISMTVAPNLPYPASIVTFKEADLAPLYEKDAKTDQLKIRKGKAVKLDGSKLGIRLRSYQRTVNNESEEMETVLIDELSITCKRVELSDAAGANQDDNTSMNELYHRIYPKDTQFLFDIKDVLERSNVQIPQRVYIYTSATGKLAPTTNKLIRMSGAIKDRGDVLRYYDNDQYETKTQATFFCMDIYPDREKTFNLRFTAYSETCEETGLDTGDQDLWGDLMMAHPLSAHFVCQYNEKATMGLTINHPQSVAFRDQMVGENGQITHGTFVFTVKQWVMDWKSTLQERAIEITKEAFLETFKEANAGLSSQEKKFKVATVDGQDELVFISVLNRTNPIVTNGARSKVINFGSGRRPTYSTQDASPIINRTGARFYALTGVPKEQTKEWTTPAEGTTVFKEQIKDMGAKYQLFVVQDLDDNKEEKVKK